MSKNIIIPENLATELFEMVTLRHSGPSLVEDVRLCLQDNIELLNMEKVFSKDIQLIKIGLTSFGTIEDGWISENIIQNAIGKGRAEHNGSKKLIQALFIGCYGKEWKDGYFQFYNPVGTLKSIEVPVRDVNQNEGVQKQAFGNISFEPNKFNILILPFYNPENSMEVPTGLELKRRFIEFLEGEETKMRFEYLKDVNFDYTSLSALKIGHEIPFTDMVIWGRDWITDGLYHQIYIHYLTISDITLGECSNKEFEKIFKLEVPGLIALTEDEGDLEMESFIYNILLHYSIHRGESERPKDVLGKMFKIWEKNNNNENEAIKTKEQDFCEIAFDSEKFNILILPFYNPEDFTTKTSAGNELKRRLTETSDFDESILDVAYLPYDAFDYSTKMAKKIGSEIKYTNMVVWGVDSKFENLSHQIYFHYLYQFNDSDKLVQAQGRTDKIEVLRIVEITEGEMHLEIEDILYLVLAIKFFHEGNYNSSLENLKNIFYEKYRNDYLYAFAAECYRNLELVDSSKNILQKALKIYPKSFVLNRMYCELLLYDYKDPTEARKYVKDVIDLEPGGYNGYLIYTSILEALNDFKGAFKYYKKVIDLAPNDGLIHWFYGNFLRDKLKKFNDAKEHYEISLRINPNDSAANLSYAELLFWDLDDKEGAKKHIEKALEFESDNLLTHILYAKLLIKLEDYKGAKEHYEIALRINPEDADANLHYSIFLRDMLKLKNKSRLYYKRAIRLDPSLKTMDFGEFF